MEAQISFITLGVEDLERATRFYEECLQLARVQSPPFVSFFQVGNIKLALWSRASLAADAGLPCSRGGFAGFSLSCNVKSETEVDSLLLDVSLHGGKIVRPAHHTDWGVYCGYFTDPDGFLWEVAYNAKFRHESL